MTVKMFKSIESIGLIVILWSILLTTEINGQLQEQYIGCFVDNENDQKWEPVLTNVNNLTIEICIDKCHSGISPTQSAMTFAALTNGRRCTCRDNSGRQLHDRYCSVKCSGNQQQNCGGNLANTFYSQYTVCRVGFFGPNCDQSCRCKGYLQCDRKSGICPNKCEDPWIGARCNTTRDIEKQYIGCFGDGPEDKGKKVMSLKNPGSKTGEGKSNTIEFCLEICSNNSCTYAGMQYGYDCFCGEIYNTFGNKTHNKRDLANCSFPCSGNANQTCGGGYANSVYYVCPVGFYGRDCANRCHCSDGGPCRFNGSCVKSTVPVCKLGWTGPACSIRGCRVNNGDCSIEEQCEVIELGYRNITACRNTENCKIDHGNCGVEEKCHRIDLGYAISTDCRPVQRKLERYYVGCFYSKELLQSTIQAVLKNATDLNLDMCIVNCRRKTQLTYAGVVNGSTCFCTDSYDTQISDRSCGMRCTGSHLQRCGGPLRIESMVTIYSIYTVCPVGNFGDACRKVCHCKNQSPCNRFTGGCSNGCDGNWTGISCNNSLASQQYIGCYRDNQTHAMDEANPGDLTGRRRNYTNSIEFCTQICSWNNYAYAGMQYGYDCHCGNKYDRYGSRSERDCNRGCPANSSQKCGGVWANSVYYTCPRGFYGRNCVDRIHYLNGRPCINGSCTCEQGWTGETCGTRDCGIKNGGCEDDEKCETIDLHYANLSACRCKDGSYRENNTCRPTHLHYVGCSKGNTTQYISVELPTSDTLTIDFCIQQCRHLNTTYSIIQAGANCLCGDGYGEMLSDAECRVPCAGNKLQYCGGTNTIDGTPVYVVYTARSFLRQYIGCYKDLRIPRAMEKQFSWSGAENNTIDACIRHCAFNNYTYAGLQYRYDCFCWHSFNKYGPYPDSNCNEKCSGNISQICGGTYANSVYAVNHILGCFSDKDCKANDTCSVIDLNYTNNTRCRCKQGFNRMNLWDYCTDIDECKAGTSTCSSISENCINNEGSYKCECKSGFVLASGNCEDIDECKNASLLCNTETEVCNNTLGSYMCQCKRGYENSTSGNCADVDECHSSRSPRSCDEVLENCVNNIGSFVCECSKGYTKKSGTKCTGPTPGESSSAAVISVVILLVVIIFAIFILVWFLRKRFFMKKENGESKTSKVEYSNHKEKSTNESQDTSLYSNDIVCKQISSKIPADELPALFKTMKSHPGTLEKEFKRVPTEDSSKTCREGKKKELKHRNRFQNIIPYDQNRVILHQSHDKFSDYINASFIKSYNQEEKLIATQGPNNDTATHFWQMIYENNVGTIVMITNLIENGKKKCACYWPESDKNVSFGDMTIALKLTETWPNYVIRHLQLIKEGSNTMDIKQWHFTVWPDHGVPSDVKGFLNFRRNVRQSMSLDKYTIVHCSAGVGRTGTFIAINYLLEQAEVEGVVDIVGCLRFLRQQRTQMVQTLDQYEFIYAALANDFIIGKTVVKAEDFDSTYQSLLVENKSSGKTQLEIQFQVLQEQWEQQVESENPSHVFAKSLDMCEISEASQAVFVQNLKTKDAYIVPEYPDKASVNYFWTICLDYGCKFIIYLDNGQNSPLFFPKQPPEFLCADSWRLECKAREIEPYGTRLTVELGHVSESEYANSGDSTTNGELTLLNVKAYVSDTTLSYDAINTAYNSMKTYLGSNKGAKKSTTQVVVVSRPNCPLSGLFIAAFNAFDMLDETKEVDLYQIVYDIKKSRSKLIPSLATYEELHRIVNHRIEYTSSASVYSNV